MRPKNCANDGDIDCLQNAEVWRSDNQYGSHVGVSGQQTEARQRDMQIRAEYKGGSRNMEAWPVLQPSNEQHQQPYEVPSAVQQRAAQYAGDEGLARPPTRPPSDWRPRAVNAEADEPIANSLPQPDPTLAR